MTDEERARFREKAKQRAEVEAQNKGIAPQAPVQMNVQQQPVQDENGQTFAYVAFGCGICDCTYLYYVVAWYCMCYCRHYYVAYGYYAWL